MACDFAGSLLLLLFLLLLLSFLLLLSPYSKFSFSSLISHLPLLNTSQRWSYAVPLEIAYHTPLTAWNPYKLPTVPYGANLDSVAAGGRNGGFTTATAYNGTLLS
jgi:hypothetical protein